MEIINYADFKISKDIISIKYKEWIDFNINFKVVDTQNIVKEYNEKFNYRKFYKDNEQKLNTKLTKEDEEKLNDKYKSIEIHSNSEMIDLYDYNKTYLSNIDQKWYKLYFIINKNELCGIYSMDIDFLYIADIILSSDCNWYKSIDTILQYHKQQCYNENFNNINLSFHKVMRHHQIIDNILESFNGTKINDKKNTYYNLSFVNYNHKFEKDLQIEITLYDDYNKNNKIAEHKTYIEILNYKLKKHDLLGWSNRNKNNEKNNEKNKHIVDKVEIIFKDRFVYFWSGKNIYIDLFIIYNNIKIKLNVENNDNFRFNKLSKREFAHKYINSYYYNIYSLITTYYGCTCNTCVINQIPSACDYFNTYTEYELYNFINTNFLNLMLKKQIELFGNENKIKNFDISYINYYYIDEFFKIKTEYENIKKNIKTEYEKNFSYIYLIQKYDLNRNNLIYKFGKSNRPIYQRLKEHGLEAKIILTLSVDNCDYIEKKILSILTNDNNIKKLKEYGNEYFFCNDIHYIINTIISNIY